MAVLYGVCGAAAQPGSPVYTATFTDCVTGDNAFWTGEGRFWFVDPGCDSYQVDVYERPTVQEYKIRGGQFASKEYFEYLDIVEARVGVDNEFLYVRLDLYGRHNSTSGGDNIEVGMMARYGFRFSSDPDGRNGVLIVSDQPEIKNEPSTVFGPIGVSGHIDTNGDVGGAADEGPTGLTVTKTDNSDEESGLNGYDKAIIADGRLEGGPVVAWVRLDPSDNTVVELALRYGALGFTKNQIMALQYFDIEAIKGGPKGPQNSLWNDKYTNIEAGSPNAGPGGLSEFGTDGLKNTYEVDTVRAAAPGTALARHRSRPASATQRRRTCRDRSRLERRRHQRRRRAQLQPIEAAVEVNAPGARRAFACRADHEVLARLRRRSPAITRRSRHGSRAYRT